MMNVLLKAASASALVGAVMLASLTPSDARSRWIGPAAAGFAAGAIVGAAAANANAYYAPRYYGAYDAYAYDTPTYVAPAYVEPTYYYGYRRGSGCATQGNYGHSVDRSACNQ